MGTEVAYINKDARQDANLATTLRNEIQAVAVANIATPATATTEEIATKVNELLVALQDSGLIDKYGLMLDLDFVNKKYLIWETLF